MYKYLGSSIQLPLSLSSKASRSIDIVTLRLKNRCDKAILYTENND